MTTARNPSLPREGLARLPHAEIFHREIGQGRPIIVIHGGPDFGHDYLLPDMDRLSSSYRLIYYDQRGRGRSGSRFENISMRTEIADLDGLLTHLHLDSVALLGHSWGGVLAMEYAIRHRGRVSHLILMNTGPGSSEDYRLLRREVGSRKAVHEKELTDLVSSAAYRQGDPEAVAAWYRIHFGTTIRRPEHLERVVGRLKSGFTPENIRRGRLIEETLYNETWLSDGYDLIPFLKTLHIPTLVIHGDYDFIPVECAARIAEAIPEARFRLLRDCGHFAYIESSDEVRAEIGDLLAS